MRGISSLPTKKKKKKRRRIWISGNTDEVLLNLESFPTHRSSPYKYICVRQSSRRRNTLGSNLRIKKWEKRLMSNQGLIIFWKKDDLIIILTDREFRIKLIWTQKLSNKEEGMSTLKTEMKSKIFSVESSSWEFSGQSFSCQIIFYHIPFYHPASRFS